MDAGRVQLFVEQFAEPYTAMTLLGVGGYCSAEPHVEFVEIRYDGITATTVRPKPSPPHSPLPYHFAIHLPWEATAKRVQVVAHAQNGKVEHWYDQAISEIRTQPLNSEKKSLSQKLSPRNLLSPLRWMGRIGRAFEFAQTLYQKVSFRLFKRRWRPRSLHDTYLDGTCHDFDSLEQMKSIAKSWRYQPVISILCPVYNVEPKWLSAAVESVRQQVYERWELCLADDASTNRETVNFLKSLVGTDPRIKITFRKTNGHICEATNSAADLATGEFVALMDNDDELKADALYHVAALLQTNRDFDLIYSDEDKMNGDGHRYDPQFKPDWSPELLLSYNYINHFTVLRRSIFEKVGRFRKGYEGSQDHDLLLRFTEQTDRVAHISKILYHWRALPSSTAAGAGVKRYVHTSGRKAVEESIQRRGWNVSAYVPQFAEKLGLPVLAFDGPDDGPAVDVIICGSDDGIDRAKHSIRNTTNYRNYTLIRCNDDSVEGRNRAAALCNSPWVLFLQADTVPTEPRWLSRMMAHSSIPHVSVCGGLIRDENNRIVSAGVVQGMRDGTGPADAFAGLKPDDISYYFYAEVTRNVAAVSGKCLLTSRKRFEQLGGFDADRFPYSSWDIDYAARVRGLGDRCVHVAGAELKIFAKQGDANRHDDPLELIAYRKAHGQAIDPYHNPNFSSAVPFELRGDLPAAHCKQTIRTLIFAHNLAAAEGAPRYLSDIVTGLQSRRSIDPIVFSPTGGVGEKVYHDSNVQVEIFQQPWNGRLIDGKWDRTEYANALAFFSAKLDQIKPELVVANTLLAFPLVEAAARAGIPCVWIIHESYSEAVLQNLFSPFAKGRCEAAFLFATRIVPCSHDTAALFARLDHRKIIRVVHNAVHPREIDDYQKRVSRDEALAITAGPRDTIRIIAVGTICERKGQHLLVEAAAKLASKKANFAIQLIGAREGIPYLEYVRRLIARHQLENNVSLIPETDAKPYFRTADIFVCTSYMETYSRSILEAEAFGLPIVSTPCCGVGEQVSWGYNALAFPLGDSQSLSERLRVLLDDAVLRKQMGRASRAMFELHPSYEEMLNSFEFVFRSAAGPKFRQSASLETIQTLKKAA